MWLGLSNQGDRLAFEEAMELVGSAQRTLEEAGLPAEQSSRLTLQIDALRQDLDILIELYEERFYGIFPLARLLITSPMADEGFNITEQLHHPPDIAAVETATRSFAKKINRDSQPRILILSEPDNPKLENVAHQVLAQEGNSLPLNRRALVKAIGPDDLRALDNNQIDPNLIGRLMATFDTENLVLVNLKRASTDNDDLVKYTIFGDLYQRGEAIQGSPVNASSAIRVDSFFAAGSIRDRRDMFWPINLIQLVLLATALVWSTRQDWSVENPPPWFNKLILGAALFFFGLAFNSVSIVLLRRIAPEPSAMLTASWWWPALAGVLATLGGGLVAWIAQAQLKELLPKASTARSVGSLFALVALGTTACFVHPVLLLEGAQGFDTLIPFVLASISLAILFAFAVRTGPPVPHYFAFGPMLVAPLLGVSLMMVSPTALWSAVGASCALWLLAVIRHRYAVAHGTEEPEPNATEAAHLDQERLLKVANKLVKKRPQIEE